jgi:hypothetical protein
VQPSGPPGAAIRAAGCGKEPPGAAIRAARCGHKPRGAAIRAGRCGHQGRQGVARSRGCGHLGRQVRPSGPRQGWQLGAARCGHLGRRVRPGGVDEAVRPGSRPPSTRRPSNLCWQWPQGAAKGPPGAAIRAANSRTSRSGGTLILSVTRGLSLAFFQAICSVSLPQSLLDDPHLTSNPHRQVNPILQESRGHGGNLI